MGKWAKLSETIFRFRDSCNVYCLVDKNEALVVDSGTGAWLDFTNELPAPPVAVVCTHHFRDHSAGAAEASRRGMAIFAPYWEREFFTDAQGFFQRRETYIVYDNIWDLFGPIESVPIHGWLRDWETVTISSFSIHVIPTAGVTPGSVSFLVHCDGKRVLFCGELIHSPGKIARIAPLQYNYNDLTGATNLLHSISTVKKLEVDLLAPSMGPELISEPNIALDLLAENLRFALSPRPEAAETLKSERSTPLTEISPSVYQAHHAFSSTYFVVSRNKEVLAIDYGYDMLFRFGSSYPFPRNRMSTLHSLEEIEGLTGSKRIDAVLLTHFHDDHVNGIPLLQRLFMTRCYAGENFAEILSHPERFSFPCVWPEKIEVVPLPLDVPFEWNEFSFRLYEISGHTRYSTMIEFQADGMKYLATGDQYIFFDPGIGKYNPGTGPYIQNHVYRNGTSLSSFKESNDLIARIKPDVLLPGHGRAYKPSEEYYRSLSEYDAHYTQSHVRLLPLADTDTHFGVDGRSGWLEPYRVRMDRAAPITYLAHVRNPYGDTATLSVALTSVPGWIGNRKSVNVRPRDETAVALTITPPEDARCRRQPVVLELSSETERFGQVAEALVTIGYPVF